MDGLGASCMEEDYELGAAIYCFMGELRPEP